MNQFWQIIILGLAILIVAIVVNLLSNSFGILTWYNFLALIAKQGFKETVKKSWMHLPFLLVIYPIILGATAFYIQKFIKPYF
jgi:hypothetical protein